MDGEMYVKSVLINWLAYNSILLLLEIVSTQSLYINLSANLLKNS